MALGTRGVGKWLKRLMYSPGARLCGRRVAVGGLMLFTLMVIVARLDSEAQLEANTLVLKAGFPARITDKASASRLQPQDHNELLRHLSSVSSSSDLPQSSLQASVSRGQRRFPRHASRPQLLDSMHMAALVSAQRPKWLQQPHGYQPPLDTADRQSQPSCKNLILNDLNEQQRAKDFMDLHQRVEKPASEYIEETKNCSRFIAERGYVMAATAEEVAFPIAYSIMMYTGLEQAERLLRAVYRPHNYHCIHVDLKAPEELIEAARAIADCLPNVFVASRLNKVYWATWSSLEALIFCMDDLWKLSDKWKYYINLTGQEFPLKTNLQIVRILSALNGSNVVDASTDSDRSSRWYNNFGPPHSIVPYKGMVFIMACRGFVDYILHSPVARDFMGWVRYTDMPDETFFPSLNHNPHLRVPGSYAGPPDTNALTKPYLARYVSWGTKWRDGFGRYNFRYPCFGMQVRNICIFGVGDLPLLTNRKELFVNKLYSTFEPLALNCLEEWLVNMTIAEYAGHVVFSTAYYSSLDIVRNKVV